MLKYEYRIMYLIADTKVLALKRLAREQQNEIIRLKAENKILTEGNKYFDMAPAVKSTARQINLIA